jgi:hypothetical protein
LEIAMNERSAFRLSPQLILGAGIVALGLVFLLDNLGFIYIREAWDFWPALLIIFGLSKLAQPRGASGRIAGFIFTVVGAAWLLDNLRVLRFDLWDYWPLLLVFIGVSMVWRAWTAGTFTPGGSEGEGRISAVAILGGVKRASSASDFRSAELTAIMGGCDIDLRQASIKNSPAVINVFTIWGGIDIKVPNDWSVELQGVPLMAGFDDKTFHPQNSAKRLLVKGLAIMGGVEVLN